MNGKSRLAWELYLKMETSGESFSILQLIANDCYKVGEFYYSAKAFDVLERLDPNPEYWEGKRGACVGVFQQVIAGAESKELLRDVVSMLRNTNNPQVEYIIRIIKKWAKENGVMGLVGNTEQGEISMSDVKKQIFDEHQQNIASMERVMDQEKARQESYVREKLKERKMKKGN